MMNCNLSCQPRLDKQRDFWKGKLRGLILISPKLLPLYDTDGYAERFDNPQKMWESEMRRTAGAASWLTDGIPTVRSNLGTVFIPAIAGQNYQIQDSQMPWPGEPLLLEKIRSARNIDIAHTDMMKRAEAFYRIHQNRHQTEAYAYLPDTQGVFDLAHLLYGDEIFYDLGDPQKTPIVHEILDICLDLYIQVTRHIKNLINEPATEMIHGHGTGQGIYFSCAGTRISEDTATLLSPTMIEEFVLPYVEKAAQPFGGAFFHFCGKHEFFLSRLCQMDCVQAIDLGNPEMYDTRKLLELCAKTDTVLYSKLMQEEGENWETYTRRIANLVKATSARCILRAVVVPDNEEQAHQMYNLWHEIVNG